jgi:hypothetical protein
MHPESKILMRYFRDNYLLKIKGSTIIDIGSMKVSRNQGTYRKIFEPDFKYIGMDINLGRNVDIVGYENIIQSYDILISGQVMEHVKRPWEFIRNLQKYYTKYICIIAPHTAREHKYPFDTYRYMPDGMRDLFEYAEINILEIIKDKADTMGIGTHKEYTREVSK